MSREGRLNQNLFQNLKEDYENSRPHCTQGYVLGKKKEEKIGKVYLLMGNIRR